MATRFHQTATEAALTMNITDEDTIRDIQDFDLPEPRGSAPSDNGSDEEDEDVASEGLYPSGMKE